MNEDDDEMWILQFVRLFVCFPFGVTFLNFLKADTAGAMDELPTEVTNPFGLDNMHRERVLFLFSC